MLLASCSAGGLPGAPTGGASGATASAAGPQPGGGTGLGGPSSAPSGDGTPTGAGTIGAGASSGADSGAGTGVQGPGAGASAGAGAGAGSSGAGAGSSNSGSAGQPGNTSSTGTTTPVTVKVGRSVEFAGWTATVKSLTMKPPVTQGLPPTVTLDMVFDNPADISGLFGENEESDGWLTISCGNHHYTPQGNIDFPQVPGHSTGEGTASFAVDQYFDPKTAVLTIGDSSEVQSVIPLGAAGTTVSSTSRKVVGTTTLTSDKVTVTITKVELRSDLPKALKQAPSDKRYLLFTFNVHNGRSSDMDEIVIGDSNFTLTEPSGNTIEGDNENADGWYSDAAVANVLPQSSRTGLVLTFVIDNPTAGTYQLNYNIDEPEPNPQQKATDTWKFTV